MFEYLIQYLRNGCQKIELDSQYDNKLFLLEIDFWGIPKPRSIVEHQLVDLFKSQPTGIPQKMIDKWIEIGPIDIFKWIDDTKVDLDHSLQVEEFKCANGLGQGQIKDGCNEGLARRIRSVNYKDGAQIYEGERKNEYAHGYGRSIRKNLEVFEGYYIDGLPQGKGRLAKNNGTIIEGIYDKGRLTS